VSYAGQKEGADRAIVGCSPSGVGGLNLDAPAPVGATVATDPMWGQMQDHERPQNRSYHRSQ
jgi:hypothetical protein